MSLAVGVAAADEGQGRKMTAKELAKLGFFEDFAELDLEELLQADEVTSAVASGQDTPLAQTPGVVTVLSGEQVRALGARTLEDLLRTVAGIDVITNGLGRKRIVVRGAPTGIEGASEGVLVLFNGHPLNEDIAGGATAINLDIPVDNLKRVEVLRGPGSSVYGGGAVHAVVSLLTYDAEDFRGTELGVNFGSFGTQQYVLRVGQTTGSLAVNGFIRFSDSGGPRLPVPADAESVADRSRVAAGGRALSEAPGRTDDERRSLEVNYRVTYRDLELSWRVRNERSGAFVGPADVLGEQNELSGKQVALSAQYRRSIPGVGDVVARVGHTRNTMSELLQFLPAGFALPLPSGGTANFSSGVFVQNILNTRRSGVSGVLQRDIGEHALRAGVSLSRESTGELQTNSNLDFDKRMPQNGLQPLRGAVTDRARTRFGVQLQDVWTRSELTVTAGLRWDVLSDTRNAVSPRLAVVRPLPRDSSLKLLYGRAFRPPSFQELVFNRPGYQANPDLRPERVDVLEASVFHRRDGVRVAATGYLGFLRNPIGPQDPFSPLAAQPWVNGPGVNLRGLELEAHVSLPQRQTVFLSYAVQSPRFSGSGLRVPDAPTHLAHLGASFAFQDRYLVTATWLLRGGRPRAVADTRRRLGGYGVVGVHVLIRNFYRSLELDAGADDLLDRGRSDPSPWWGLPGDYPRPGRRLFVHATFRL